MTHVAQDDTTASSSQRKDEPNRDTSTSSSTPQPPMWLRFAVLNEKQESKCLEWSGRGCVVTLFNSLDTLVPPPRGQENTKDGKAVLAQRAKRLQKQLLISEILNFEIETDSKSPKWISLKKPLPAKEADRIQPVATVRIPYVSRKATKPEISEFTLLVCSGLIAAGSGGCLTDPGADVSAAPQTDGASDATCIDLLRQFQAEVMRHVLPYGPRNFIAYISPISGQGKGEALWKEQAEPILKRTPHTYRYVLTTHRGHAEEMAETSPLAPEDVIVAVGGDGMMHEVTNGWQRRMNRITDEEWAKISYDAFPDAPRLGLFPTGSGCALAKTLDLLEPVQAAVALAHMQAVSVDLIRISFTGPAKQLILPGQKAVKEDAKEKQKTESSTAEPTDATASAVPDESAATTGTSSSIAPEKASPDLWDAKKAVGTIPPDRYAFLSLSAGIVSDIDVGSEKWRWMGNARFTAYAMQQVVSGVPKYQIKLRYIPAEGKLAAASSPKPLKSKTESGTWFKSALESRNIRGGPQTRPADNEDDDQPKTAKKPTFVRATGALIPADDKRWVSVDQKHHVLTIACNIPFLARDMKGAPYSVLDDGMMDLVFSDDAVGRSDLLKTLVQIEEGDHVDNERMNYVKCQAIEMTVETGVLMADGDVIPQAPVQATMLPRAMRMIRSGHNPLALPMLGDDAAAVLN